MTEADIERVAAEDRGASLTAAGDWTDAGRLAADDGTGHATARSESICLLQELWENDVAQERGR